MRGTPYKVRAALSLRRDAVRLELFVHRGSGELEASLQGIHEDVVTVREGLMIETELQEAPCGSGHDPGCEQGEHPSQVG